MLRETHAIKRMSLIVDWALILFMALRGPYVVHSDLEVNQWTLGPKAYIIIPLPHTILYKA